MRKLSENKRARTSDDGGYYAIKGFLYQFDKTLIEIMINPYTTVCIENRQDIDYEDYVLQVKHKERQDYFPSKIRDPIEKLIESFSQDPSRKYCLYCHFRNMTPHDWQLTIDELDSIISTRAKARYPKPLRERFSVGFTVCFSEDYETQFEQTITLIKTSFSIHNDDEAILYHSIFRSKLLDRSITPKSNRKVCFSDLNDFLKDAEVTIFHAAYMKYMGTERYNNLIKKQYFTFSVPNINNFERLFLIEHDSAAHQVDLIEIVNRLAKKFYRKGKSPQPYIIVRNLDDTSLKMLKRALIDSGTVFFDGTYFDGDQFRLDALTKESVNNESFTVKIVPESQIQNLLQQAKIKELFQFFVDKPVDLPVPGKHYRIQINDTGQIKQMIS
ncbi:MAG: hypothetical protein WC749_09090 [Dehalococcoidia bacterium]